MSGPMEFLNFQLCGAEEKNQFGSVETQPNSAKFAWECSDNVRITNGGFWLGLKNLDLSSILIGPDPWNFSIFSFVGLKRKINPALSKRNQTVPRSPGSVPSWNKDGMTLTQSCECPKLGVMSINTFQL